MRRFAATAVATAILLTPFAADAQRWKRQPKEYVTPPSLNAPVLTDDQEASFNGSDGKLSPFWKQAKGPAQVMRPSTHTNADGRDEFKNDKDAQVTFRAAHGSKGVYLLIEIRDDEWSKIFKKAGYDYAYDSIELMFDSHNAKQIFDCGRDCRPKALAKWDLTGQTRALQFWTDAKQPNLNFTVSDPNYFPSHEVAVKEAAQRFGGLAVDRFRKGKQRIAEILLPWSQLGVAEKDRNPGHRFAFTISYHDNDTRRDHPYMINTLRWVGNGNPFGGKGHWGEIALVGEEIAKR